MKRKRAFPMLAVYVLCSLMLLMDFWMTETARGQIIVSGPGSVLAGETVQVKVQVSDVSDPWLRYQFGEREQKFMVIEAEDSQGNGVITDDAAASGGRARAGGRYAQVCKGTLPSYEPAIYIWYRGRAADFCLKDANNNELAWHWAKGKTLYEWRRFGPYAPSELNNGYGLMVGTLASGYEKGYLDAVLLTTDSEYTPRPALPLPEPGEFTWQTSIADIGEHEIPVNVYDGEQLLGSAMYTISVFQPADLNLFDIDFNATKLDCINPALFGTNDQEILVANPFEDETYQTIMASMNMDLVRIHLSGLLDEIFPTENSPGDFSRLQTSMERTFKREDRSGQKILFCFAKPPTWVDMTNPTHRQIYAAKLVALADYLVNQQRYPISYWEIFNEIYGSGMDPERVYWQFYNLVAPMLKAVTPAVKVGGPALSWPQQSILRDFLENCKENVDFLSWHIYLTGTVETPTETIMQRTGIFGDYARQIRQLVNELVPNRDLELALTEYNINYDWNPHDPRQATNIGAVWAASVLIYLAKAGQDLAMTWHSKGGGTFGLVSGANEPRPMAELLYLLNKYLRNAALLPVNDTEQKVEILVARKGARGIVLLVNKHAEPQIVRLTITSDQRTIRSSLERSVSKCVISDAGPYSQTNIHFFESGQNYGTISMAPYSLQLLLFENYQD